MAQKTKKTTQPSEEHQTKPKVNTTKEQMEAIIWWLKKEGNLDLVNGEGKKGRPNAGTLQKKDAAYASMAEFVNRKCGCNWESADARSRFIAYLQVS